MYMYMHIHIINIFSHIHTHTYIYTHTHMYIYTYTHIYINIHIHKHEHIYKYVRMNVYVHGSINIFTCVFSIYVYIRVMPTKWTSEYWTNFFTKFEFYSFYYALYSYCIFCQVQLSVIKRGECGCNTQCSVSVHVRIEKDFTCTPAL